MDKRTSKDSLSNNGESSSRIFTSINEEDEKVSSCGIFERKDEEEVLISNIFRDSTSKRTFEESTSGRIFKDPSPDEEEHVCLEVSDEEDGCEVKPLYYEKLFIFNATLTKELDKI